MPFTTPPLVLHVPENATVTVLTAPVGPGSIADPVAVGALGETVTILAGLASQSGVTLDVTCETSIGNVSRKAGTGPARRLMVQVGSTRAIEKVASA
jgi:hypothetical protein